jgi:hypothetical protein
MMRESEGEEGRKKEMKRASGDWVKDSTQLDKQTM